jgi:hypothetical protein
MNIQIFKQIWESMNFDKVDNIHYDKAIALIDIHMDPESGMLFINALENPSSSAIDIQSEYSLSDDEDTLPESILKIKYHTIVNVALETYYKNQEIVLMVIRDSDPAVWEKINITNEEPSDLECIACYKYISDLPISYYVYHTEQLCVFCESCHLIHFNLDNPLK